MSTNLSSIHTIELIEAETFNAVWRPKVERVVVNLTAGMSIHLTPADAARLADQLAEACEDAAVAKLIGDDH